MTLHYLYSTESEVGLELEVVVAVIPAFQVWPLPEDSPPGPPLPPCLAGAGGADGQVVTLAEISKIRV